jgi:hypothetical protein
LVFEDHGQFPADVVAILEAGVHPLASFGGVCVCDISKLVAGH